MNYDSRTIDSINERVAYALPKDYGYGFRGSNDKKESWRPILLYFGIAPEKTDVEVKADLAIPKSIKR